MNVVGALRIRNESRWIARVISAIQPACNRIAIFDDNSTDDTTDICIRLGGSIEVWPSPFRNTDESRDKNYLLDICAELHPDWILMIDGDELLLPGCGEILRCAMETCTQACLSLPILYAWDSERQIRVDGVYGNFRRQSAFRPGKARFHDRGGANFHCGNVPAEIRADCGYVETPLLHLGYMHAADRIRKYEWYRKHDPGNPAEDGYRHIVVGDLFPAESEFRHGGPLALVDLSARW